MEQVADLFGSLSVVVTIRRAAQLFPGDCTEDRIGVLLGRRFRDRRFCCTRKASRLAVAMTGDSW
jgi:hypothetical protein